MYIKHIIIKAEHIKSPHRKITESSMYLQSPHRQNKKLLGRYLQTPLRQKQQRKRAQRVSSDPTSPTTNTRRVFKPRINTPACLSYGQSPY